jgi:hypothetical protein
MWFFSHQDLRTERNSLARRIALAVAVCIVLVPSTAVLSQIEPAREMYVVVSSEYLLESPRASSPSTASVSIGDKVTVLKSATPGWYSAYLTSDPSKYGYIRASSVGTRQALTRVLESSAANDKATPRPPKEVILDDSQDSALAAKTRSPILASNQCVTTLFCPDPEEIYIALLDNQAKFEKGKFEKTVDWEKRRAMVLNQISLGPGRTLGDRMTFLYEVGTGSLEPREMQYNADRELWTVPVELRVSGDQKCVPLFGPKYGRIVCLVFGIETTLSRELIVSMPPLVAAANDNKLQLAFVGRIRAPYVWNNAGTRIQDVLNGIYFELEEIVCINPKSGQRWKIESKTNTEALQ